MRHPVLPLLVRHSPLFSRPSARTHDSACCAADPAGVRAHQVLMQAQSEIKLVRVKVLSWFVNVRICVKEWDFHVRFREFRAKNQWEGRGHLWLGFVQRNPLVFWEIRFRPFAPWRHAHHERTTLKFSTDCSISIQLQCGGASFTFSVSEVQCWPLTRTESSSAGALRPLRRQHSVSTFTV